MNFWKYIFEYLMQAIPLGMTFVYGSTGEILTEKAGHLNLGIPGIMCIGAAGGCTMLQALMKNGTPAVHPVLVVILGILAAFLAAALIGLLYSFLTVTLKANQNVTGLTITIFGVGAMKHIMIDLSGSMYLKALPYFRYPFVLAEQGTMLRSMQLCGVMVFLAILIALATSYFLNHTKAGLHLRAVGENPATADAVGINVTAYKYWATCIGSGIAGLGGLFYVMDYSGSPEAYKSIEPFGWLSIALVIFALWRPHMTIIGSTIFGLLFSCSSYISNISWINVTMAAKPLMKMLPYLFTILILVVTSIRNKRENQPPSSLGLSYFREER